MTEQPNQTPQPSEKPSTEPTPEEFVAALAAASQAQQQRAKLKKRIRMVIGIVLLIAIVGTWGFKFMAKQSLKEERDINFPRTLGEWNRTAANQYSITYESGETVVYLSMWNDAKSLPWNAKNRQSFGHIKCAEVAAEKPEDEKKVQCSVNLKDAGLFVTAKKATSVEQIGAFAKALYDNS